MTGLSLGSTGRRAPTASKNILGDVDGRQPARLTGVERPLSTDRLSVHWYGKREVYHLRKMGHLTLVGEQDTSPGGLLAAIRDAAEPLTFAETD